MEIKIDCPIQVGDLVWVKPEDSYNFIQSKVTNVSVVVENGHASIIYYCVEDLNYQLSDSEDGVFLNKEDIFKFYADELRDKIPEEFGKYVFTDKDETAFQILNNCVRKLNSLQVDETLAKQIHHTVDVINKEKQGY